MFIVPLAIMTDDIWGSYSPSTYILFVLISVILSNIIMQPLARKGYRYGQFNARLVIPDGTEGPSYADHYGKIFEELFTNLDPTMSRKDGKYHDFMVYSFPKSTCTFELSVPNEGWDSDLGQITLKSVTQEEMPFLLELKDLISMALEIEDQEGMIPNNSLDQN